MKPIYLLIPLFLLLCLSPVLAGDRYPGKHWSMYATSEEAGFSADQLEEAKNYWASLQSAAALVVVDGAVVAAWGDVERRFMLHSARKSLMSGLYGIQVDAGRMDMEKTMAELGINDTNPPLNEEEKEARILDLIRARSGVYHPAAAEPPQNRKPKRGSHKPGTHWCYNNWDFNALGTILEQEAEVRIFEEFNRAFARPLGMEDYRARDGFYQHEPNKSIHPAYHFRMSARDMARFGYLFLKQGKWKGKQILSEDWVRTSTRLHSDDAWGDGYGYMWWVSLQKPFRKLGMYSALGVGEQSIDVIPKADMVIVHRTNTYDRNQVTGKERLTLIKKILDARTLPASRKPKLVPLPSQPKPCKAVRLTKKENQALCGSVPVPAWGIKGKITLDKNDLVLEMSMGHFGLIPIAENTFLLEDIHDVFYFEREGAGAKSRLVTEIDVTMEGYQLLEAGDTDQAIKAFQKAVGYFPASSNLHDSLGEAYMKKGMTAEAVKSYEKSIELNPENENGIAMLKKLKKN